MTTSLEGFCKEFHLGLPRRTVTRDPTIKHECLNFQCSSGAREEMPAYLEEAYMTAHPHLLWKQRMPLWSGCTIPNKTELGPQDRIQPSPLGLPQIYYVSYAAYTQPLRLL